MNPYFLQLVTQIVKQMGLPDFKPKSEEDYKALAIVGIITVNMLESQRRDFKVFENLLLPSISGMVKDKDTVEKIIEILRS